MGQSLLRSWLAGSALLACAAPAALAGTDQPDINAPLGFGAVSPDSLTLSPAPAELSPQYLADAAATRRPLMRVLDHYGLAKPLDDLRIDIYGFIQVSYTYNLTDPNTDDPFGANPARHRILGRMFDHHHDEFGMNRFDTFFQRTVDYRAGQWDWGFLVEALYGLDAAMMHSNGMFDYDWPTFRSHADPEYQYDLPQVYVDMAVPVGTGLRVRAGKFTTLIGYESCDPTTRTSIQFYSRTWLLTLGIPMYQTGVIGTYDITDNVTINAGFTRGWDQAIEDNNDAIDFLGSVNWRVSDNLTVYGATSVGPEQPNDNSHYRTLLNGTIYYTPDVQGPWIFAVDSIFGWENNQITRWDSFGVVTHDDVPVGDTYWLSLAGFAAYKINPNLVAKGRIEWFRDQDGTRWRRPADNTSFVAAPMNDPYVDLGSTVNSIELTGGFDIVPFPHDAPELLVRPEIRLDWADKDIFVSGTKDYEVTVAVDVIYKF